MPRQTNTNTKFKIQPTVNYCFKKIMEDIDLLKDFLSIILDIPYNDIISIEIIPPQLNHQSKNNNLVLLNAKLHLKSNNYSDTKIQILYCPRYEESSLFYLSKIFAKQLTPHSKYSKIDKCIYIGILNFNLFKGSKEYYSKFSQTKGSKNDITPCTTQIHILELPKLKYASEISKEYSETTLYDWCKFFSIEN